nr:Aromatic hydrocarbon utilization transcriptional regulator CatR (LysR family) [uncultured bacterium]
METKTLEYFRVVYQEQNMHRAADKLYISQQGLSRTIQTLEKELECKLFERDSLGMHPTAAGDRLYESVRKIQSELDGLHRDIEELTTGKKILHVPAAYGVLHLLYPAIRQFSEAQPKIEVRWAEHIDQECEQLLSQQQVELILTVLGEDNPAFDIHPLTTRRIMLLVFEGHPLYEKEAVSVQDLKNEKLLTVGHGYQMFATLQKACLKAGFYPYIEGEISEINLCHKLVHLGEGLGLTVDFIADMVDQKNVRALHFVEDCFTWRVGIVRNKKTPLSPAAKAFWKHIINWPCLDNK